MGQNKTLVKLKAWASRRSVIVTIVIFSHVLGLISSLHAVMSTRTSQGAIAWVVSLNTFPYVAVPAYWVLGRSNFQGYVTARQEGDLQIEHVTEEVLEEVAAARSTSAAAEPSIRAAELLADMPTLSGNEVELLVDGDATFASIFDGIERARDYILFQFFIVKNDGLGREVKQRLIARAKDGVRVYFLYDEVGSHKLPRRYVRELREAGVDVRDFNTRKGSRNRFQINFRNHRKVVVIDGN